MFNAVRCVRVCQERDLTLYSLTLYSSFLTGRGGSGSKHAREQQAGIIKLLLERGTSLADKDGRGKKVREAATSEWVRTLLVGELG
jgi:hypothetical protein